MIGTSQQVIEHIRDKEGIYKCVEIKETRSQAQNRLYWKWIAGLVGEFGNKGIFITGDDLHEGLREKLIESTIKKNTFTGELKTVRKSTSKLNKKEFSKYIKDIELYLWQTFEVSFPLPGEIEYNLI